jgi:hypothetical protein
MTQPVGEHAVGVRSAGLDGVALKPTEHDLASAADLPADTLVLLDYEGREHLPDRASLAALAADRPVRLTTPVRADGFDPLGDDGLVETVPEQTGRVLVAGHAAYLGPEERSRAVAPRLQAAVAACPDPWVGTEGVERIALAAGGTQFELLSSSTERDLRALRAAGFEGEVAVYAPVVLAAEEAAVLNAVGDYAARRPPVASELPDSAPTDSRTGGQARDVLLEACREYALCGDPTTVRERVETLRAAGADHVVGYPARGIDDVL